MSEKVPGIYARDRVGQPDGEDVMASWKGFWREMSELETEKSQLKKKKKDWLATSHSTGVDPKYLDGELTRVATKLKAMNAELKEREGNECRQGLVSTDLPAHDAKAAPQSVPIGQDVAIDLSMLADPGQLIEAFGKFTGMDASWFDNLTDTPRLLAARKVTGTGGKHYTPPLFCPFEVMQWLIDEKRKKGRKVSPDKAWQLLQSNFEKVYNTRSAGDPR